jgi:hypothetical protein
VELKEGEEIEEIDQGFRSKSENQELAGVSLMKLQCLPTVVVRWFIEDRGSRGSGWEEN